MRSSTNAKAATTAVNAEVYFHCLPGVHRAIDLACSHVYVQDHDNSVLETTDHVFCGQEAYRNHGVFAKSPSHRMWQSTSVWVPPALDFLPQSHIVRSFPELSLSFPASTACAHSHSRIAIFLRKQSSVHPFTSKQHAHEAHHIGSAPPDPAPPTPTTPLRGHLPTQGT